MRLSTAVLAVFLSMLLHGCTDLLDVFGLNRDAELDVHAEYAPSHPWIGKCAAYSEPMAYMTNMNPGFEHTETIRIGRSITDAQFADYLLKTPEAKDLIVTPIPSDTTFKVIAVFTYVHKGLSRMFTDDVEMAVLQDNHGQISAGVLTTLKPCN